MMYYSNETSSRSAYNSVYVPISASCADRPGSLLFFVDMIRIYNSRNNDSKKVLRWCVWKMADYFRFCANNDDIRFVPGNKIG